MKLLRYTDEGIQPYCSLIIESVVSAVKSSITPFLVSKSLSLDIEKQLISVLSDKAQWYVWFNSATFDAFDKSLIANFHGYLKKLKGKITATWLKVVKESIQQANAKDALKYINEAMFEIKFAEINFDLIGEKEPYNLPHLKNFFTSCIEYQKIKLQLETPITSNACTNNTFCPVAKVSISNNSKELVAGTSGINGTSGIKRDEDVTDASLQKGQIKVSESDKEYVLGANLLLKIYIEFNGDLWEDVKLARFLSVFSSNTTTALTIRDGKKELFYGLLRRMYDFKQDNTINQYDWIKPVIENHNLSMSGYTNVLNKLFNARQKSKPQRAFIAKLNKIMPSIDNSPH